MQALANKKSKTSKRKRVSPERMKQAVTEVVTNKVSIREAGTIFKIAKSSLQRAVNSARQLSDIEHFKHSPNIGNRKIFTSQQERDLIQYLITCSKMCYGLGPNALRILAYKFAKEVNATLPLSWHQDKKASEDWLRSFRRRHADVLSLRKPEKTSLSRATAFNQNNVNLFFDNLHKVTQLFGG